MEIKYYILSDDKKLIVFDNIDQYIGATKVLGEEKIIKSRMIKREDIGEYTVSTVLLAIDHGWHGVPMIFETMIFPDCVYCERCSTYEEALLMHERGVLAAQKGEFK